MHTCPVCGGPTALSRTIDLNPLFPNAKGGVGMLRLECIWRRTAVQAGGVPCPVPLAFAPNVRALREMFIELRQDLDRYRRSTNP